LVSSARVRPGREALGQPGPQVDVQQGAGDQAHAAQQQEHRGREAGDQGHQPADAARHQEHAGLGRELPTDRVAQVAVAVLVGGAGDDQAGGHGAQQGRDLGDHAVADGQDRVLVDRRAELQPLLDHADRQAAQQVDHHDDDAGDGVAFDELHRAVEAAVELALHLQHAPAALGLVLVDHARAQVAVDRQLLARHGVQAEPRGHLGDPLGALGDDDELHDGDDQEHHQPDHQVAAGHQGAEGVDDVPGVALDQDHPGRGDRQGQSIQRGDQQQAGKDRELDDGRDVDRHQQQHHAEADVDRHQGVQRQGRQRQDHQPDDGHHAGHQEQVAEPRHQAFTGAALQALEIGFDAHRFVPLVPPTGRRAPKRRCGTGP
jgi:hypothetical protein